MIQKRFLQSVAFTVTSLALCGCNQPAGSNSSDSTTSSTAESAPMAGTKAESGAMANIGSTEGHKAKGTVKFTPENGGVRVVANLTGLDPGEHGFHIHQNGDCSAPDGSSAGGHYNPTGEAHGAPDAEHHHIGDLGNVTADASGKANLDHVFSFLSLSGTNSIVGHAVIVHQGKDDLTSQPSGAAGPRVGCGVITAGGM